MEKYEEMWKEWFLKHKEKAGLSYRDMDRKSNRAGAAWYALLSGNRPPTYDITKTIIRPLNMDESITLNIIFRDRLLYFLEKEGLIGNGLTKQIRNIIGSLIKWDPRTGKKIRDIMSTLPKIHGTGIAYDNNWLRFPGVEGETLILTEPLRDHSFPYVAGTGRVAYLGDFAGVFT